MNSKLIAGLLATAVSMTAMTAMAAEPAAKAASAKKPAAAATLRTADGHSDLDGVWTNVSITPFERPAAYKGKFHSPEEARKLEGAAVDRFVEGNAPTDPKQDALDHTKKNCQGAGGLDCGYNSGWKDSGTTLAQVDGKALTSFVSSTPNGRVPPYKEGVRPVSRRGGGEGSQDAGPNDNPENRGLGERCLTSFGNSAGPVMLPLMYNNNYQFITTKDDVAIEVEMVHDIRHIRLNAKEHLPSNVRPWFGDSIGHWEGATLVSETTNFPAAQSFRGSDQNLKVTEKFTRTGPDRILYQFTVEDPTVWDTAWGGEYEFRKQSGLLYEYACHEGNYAMEGILAGAREAEQNAKTASK
jgi:hypothetical protein